MWLQIKKKLDSLLDYYSETSLNQTIGANWFVDFDSFNIETICRQSDCQEQSD